MVLSSNSALIGNVNLDFYALNEKQLIALEILQVSSDNLILDTSLIRQQI